MGHGGIDSFRIFSECLLCARQCSSTRDIIISIDTAVCLDLYFCVHTHVFTVVVFPSGVLVPMCICRCVSSFVYVSITQSPSV